MDWPFNIFFQISITYSFFMFCGKCYFCQVFYGELSRINEMDASDGSSWNSTQYLLSLSVL